MPKTILKAAAGLIVLALLMTIPKYVESPYALHMMILLFLSVSMGQSWNILGGFAGQYSVGHAAYFGVGAYTTMMLMQAKQIPPWIGVWAGIVLVLIVALAIGSICFRLRGPYFVLASIAVAEILRLSAINLTALTNGARRDPGHRDPRLQGRRAGPDRLLDQGPLLLHRPLPGSAHHRDHLLGAAFQTGLLLPGHPRGSGCGPLTGHLHLALQEHRPRDLRGPDFPGRSLYGIYVGFVDPPTVLGLDVSVQIMLICIIGGMGTLWGPVLGALVLVPMSEALRR